MYWVIQEHFGEGTSTEGQVGVSQEKEAGSGEECGEGFRQKQHVQGLRRWWLERLRHRMKKLWIVGSWSVEALECTLRAGEGRSSSCKDFGQCSESSREPLNI